MTAGKALLLIFGIIVIVISLGLVVAGSVALWANSALTDDEGYFTTKTFQHELDKDSYAIVSEPAEIDVGHAWVWDWGRLATFKVEGWNDDASKGIFIGVAEESDLRVYLEDVWYHEVTDFRIKPDRLIYDEHTGDSIPDPPTSQPFLWEESVSGTGTQTLRWDLESGTWVLVVMNDDGSAGLDLSVQLGVKIPWLFGVGLGFLIGGVVLLVLGIVMIYLAVRRAKATPATAG